MADQITVDTTGVAQIIALATATAQHLEQDAVLVPAGYTLQDMEPFSMTRRQFRGMFCAQRVEDFAHYYGQNADADHLDYAPVFIDPKGTQAAAVFDWKTGEDSPGHMQHTARLVLEPTPEWAALMAHAGAEAISQDTMVDFATDWGDNMTAWDDTGNGLTPSALVSVFRSVTLTRKTDTAQTLTDQSTERSAMELVEARNRITTPPSFTYHVVPFEGFGARAVVVRIILRPHTNGKDVVFRLRVKGLQRIQEELAQEFKARLVSALAGQFEDRAPPIFIGRFQDQPPTNYRAY